VLVYFPNLNKGHVQSDRCDVCVCVCDVILKPSGPVAVVAATVSGGLGDGESPLCHSAASTCHGDGAEETGRRAVMTNVWTQSTTSKPTERERERWYSCRRVCVCVCEC